MDYYRLEYRRDSSHPWIKYRDFRKKEIFSGKSNNNIAENEQGDLYNDTRVKGKDLFLSR